MTTEHVRTTKVNVEGRDNIKAFCLGYVSGESATLHEEALNQMKEAIERRKDATYDWHEANVANTESVKRLEDHKRFIDRSRRIILACLISQIFLVAYWYNKAVYPFMDFMGGIWNVL